MAKRPSPGQTKTRLTPPLTPQQAADLYECFLRDVLDTVRRVPDITPFIAAAPPDSQPYFAQLAPDFGLVPQVGQNLSEWLHFVMSHLFRTGFDQVAAVNSDSPNLPTDYLSRAFTLLADPSLDVVFGPCERDNHW